ncbi:transglutaminase domain-containing protein [Rhodococcus rhodnii]|uniref:Transglutaminase-like domain-containing protein n=2 Tax=Rhodococcus rhodnii TaxID=38312 RepID=R7WKQ4_9NOCA|nr:transglutaminase-like domain-containing protein [Rhodococcus rhodnii]EOM75891.1 hypothetical protein Rrhod_2803 [Rhodococcus rhodnii LMG 5362]TXG91057.1 transglutaminase domain-containing protein [Rhodococcus rhodnii]
MPTREVSARIDFEVTEATELEFQIAVAHRRGVLVEEELTFTANGRDVAATEFAASHGGRIHVLRDVAPTSGTAWYRARIEVQDGRDDAGTAGATADLHDRSLYLRPSRYVPVDRFYPFAASEFGTADPIPAERPYETAAAVTSWVAKRMAYLPVSDSHTDAADTLLASAGVCRDQAHLVIALLRALNVPARFVAVYAPGCDPMDFHAVAEALGPDGWRVYDPTGLAPRNSLVRIATGRDAADTAFLDNHGGSLNLTGTTITATVPGALPADDPAERVRLP